MMNLNPTYIEKNGAKEFVVLSFQEYTKLEETLHDYEDLVALRAAKQESKKEKTIPWSEVKKAL
jgi:PHD/YefM family antitoxin component YafN of YafNO toxin-antitoxin module